MPKRCATRSRRCSAMVDATATGWPERLGGRSGRAIPGSQPEMVADVVRAVLVDHERRSVGAGDLAAGRGRGAGPHHRLRQGGDRRAAGRRHHRQPHPFATDELDAIVEHTATATNAILSSCETLDEVARQPDRRTGSEAAGRHHAHLRGMQLPGHHRPAHHQGGRDAEDDRGEGRPDRRHVRQQRPAT